MTKASDSAELVAGHQSLRKDIMTFLPHRIHLSANNKYAFSREINIDTMVADKKLFDFVSA
jgi:hypothetical protein